MKSKFNVGDNAKISNKDKAMENYNGKSGMVVGVEGAVTDGKISGFTYKIMETETKEVLRIGEKDLIKE